MSKQTKLTDDGLKKLKQELYQLKNVARRDIADKIKTARGFGDLSENSEYDEAKNEQAKIEARIFDLEAMLVNVVMIDDTLDTGKVFIGSKVTLYDCALKENFAYRVVGSAESDPRLGLISDESPLGKALIGHAVGEEVIADAPGGHMHYKILDITK